MSRAKLAGGLLGATVFALTVKAVENGSARATDEWIRRRILRARSPRLDAISAVVTPLTSPPLMIACSLATAFALRSRGSRVWLPIASSPFIAMTAGACFTALLPQQCAPNNGEPCFPSGHTTGATAEALTIASVLRRENVIPRAAAVAIALLPVVGGVNRLYRDRHWTTDIIAGWSAGSAIATVLATLT